MRSVTLWVVLLVAAAAAVAESWPCRPVEPGTASVAAAVAPERSLPSGSELDLLEEPEAVFITY